MEQAHILIIDSDPSRRATLATVLQFLEYETLSSDDTREWGIFESDWNRITAVFLGPGGPDTETEALFNALKKRDQHMPVVAVMADAEAKEDVGELNRGYIGVIEPPFRYPELRTVLDKVQLYRENRRRDGGSRSLELFRNLVGTSKVIVEVRRLIEQVASTDTSVLLLGESGTGKEVVARNVHYHSKRRYKPFVPVNCGAIPAELLESELFGHEKGAFTGAIGTRTGRFEMADGGTLFLDEIGDMPLAMQVKLLRVLQEQTFERVGGNRSLSVDVRIVAATHSNLEEAIVAGRFREDLYYRLNVFPIEMPPLRARVQDFPLLVNDLINRLEHEKRGSIRLTPGALNSLCGYHWPGNVRELANLMERLVVLYPYGVVDLDDLPDKYRIQGDLREVEAEGDLHLSNLVVSAQGLPRDGIDLKEHLSKLEYMLIKQALDESGGVVAHAAKKLGMGRTTLVEKMRKYQLQRDEPSPDS